MKDLAFPFIFGYFAATHSNTDMYAPDRFIPQFKHLQKPGATVWRGTLLVACLLRFYGSCRKKQWHRVVCKSRWLAMRLNCFTAAHIHISYPRSCCINGASVEYKGIQTPPGSAGPPESGASQGQCYASQVRGPRPCLSVPLPSVRVPDDLCVEKLHFSVWMKDCGFVATETGRYPAGPKP